MSDPRHEVRAPRDTVNDDFVTVVRWAFADGSTVLAGCPVVELETSKSVIEVEAPASGRLSISAKPGEQVDIGGMLGTVTEADAKDPPAATNNLECVSPSAVQHSIAPTNEDGGRTISLAARELMKKHGVAESELPKGLVRASDVAKMVDNAFPGAAGPANATPKRQSGAKGLLGDARRSAGDRKVSVPWLILNYLWRNWFLGNLARVSPRGIITAVHRLRGVKIGVDCFIDPNAILETAYPENIFLGTDVRVAAGAVVMTHIKPPHYLRDMGMMANTVASVRLEDHCFIGVNAVVMPGVTIGRASVVASGAVVTGNVPPLCMVAGNPAKVVKRFQMTELSADEQ